MFSSNQAKEKAEKYYLQSFILNLNRPKEIYLTHTLLLHNDQKERVH